MKQLKYFSTAHSGCTTAFLSQGGTLDRTKTDGGTVGFNSLKIVHEVPVHSLGKGTLNMRNCIQMVEMNKKKQIN